MDAIAGSGPLIAGRYRLGARLGRGGMAEVFDAFDERLERRVAVKALRPDVAADVSMRQRFEGEARAAARLTHPCVVSVYDSGEHAGRAFLVMERLPGETLADVIARGPVPTSRLIPIADDLLAALEAAHDIGIIHRDIKPGNVLLTEEGRAKVADFGIAKVAMPGPREGDPTQVGLVLGTPAYLAPERLVGQPATVASDLYSAGVVLYEAATGQKPPAGSAEATVVGSPATVAPAAAVGAIDPALGRVVGRAMAFNPEDRYPSARAMATDLVGEADPTPPVTVVEAPATTVLAAPVGRRPVTRQEGEEAALVSGADERGGRRRGVIIAVILLAIVVIIVIIVLLASSGGPGKRRGPAPLAPATTPTTAVTTTVTTPATVPPTVAPPTTPTTQATTTSRTTATTRATTTTRRTSPSTAPATTTPTTSPSTTRVTTSTTLPRIPGT